uniref:Uncharacterized protein n=1 Tax=Romanomermis culicivorax TaxID=13658 RepID=A0A915HLC3_ROMCU
MTSKKYCGLMEKLEVWKTMIIWYKKYVVNPQFNPNPKVSGHQGQMLVQLMSNVHYNGNSRILAAKKVR